MKIKIQDYNEVGLIELQGEFTSDFSKPFEDTMTAQLAKYDSGVVIDMNAVTFIDSGSLEQLLKFKDMFSQSGKQLKLASLDDNCKKILEITRLIKSFDLYDDLSESIKSFA